MQVSSKNNTPGEPALRERIAASGGWQVTKQLGRGQYGTAYLVSWDEEKCGEERKGQYKDGDQAVAKVVGLEFLPEKEHNFAFQEVELMRALRHPHIVALRDHFLTEASLELVIVMEFCDSGDLRGEVKRRTQAKPPNLLPEATIMTWFVQMTLALNYMPPQIAVMHLPSTGSKL
ncbi:Serine/threonine-protein kinase Nek5 [Symbiodinium microadriaticum]|uniref:non-specific serine/threonine protein kinase n=1 Tax=Symbiodinium microadriaticum TaxID=2951 RepID=A0A1Q9DHT2_SYMMI|nr:Serine/threonine-protein kinase Nek5 [Symbiodinium microadriaticum]